jgi:hypothetical protein
MFWGILHLGTHHVIVKNNNHYVQARKFRPSFDSDDLSVPD